MVWFVDSRIAILRRSGTAWKCQSALFPQSANGDATDRWRVKMDVMQSVPLVVLSLLTFPTFSPSLSIPVSPPSSSDDQSQLLRPRSTAPLSLSIPAHQVSPASATITPQSRIYTTEQIGSYNGADRRFPRLHPGNRRRRGRQTPPHPR